MFKAIMAIYIMLLALAPSVLIAAEGVGASLKVQESTIQDSFVPRLSATAQWALVTEEVVSGKRVVDTGISRDSALVPASLVKLLVTGAVLEAMNKYPMDLATNIATTGSLNRGILNGNVVIRGKGNPFLSTPDLQVAVDKIKAKGIMEVAGDIILDDTLLEITSTREPYQGPAYSPTSALGLDLHTVAVIVEPAEEGKPPRVRVEPLNKSVRFAVSAMTVSSAPAPIEVKRLDDLSYQVLGNIPTKSGAFRRRFAVSDPALYAAGTFRTLLEQKGITVKGEVKRGRMPGDADIVAAIPGPEMKQMLRDMNVNSLNVVAENLLLLLGAKRSGAPGTREKGIAAVREQLQSLDLPMNEVTIADGSGLSTENRMTAGFLTQYLRTVTKKPWFPDFRDSLARPGYDGTVKDMQFKDSRFRVKTGMLKDSLALAGYGVDAGGKEIAFAYMVNGPGTGYLPLDAVGGEVLRYLANEVLQ